MKVRTIAADPPWSYGDALSMSDVKRSSGAHYETMTVSQICGLGGFGTVAGFESYRDSFLWLWITNPFLLDGTGARVCRAWGFEPSQIITWVKGRIAKDALVSQLGMGHFTRGVTEHLILATRGRPKKLILDKGVPNVFIAPRARHSQKPAEAYQLIERTTPGPYVELFARQSRENWRVWGHEVPSP